MRRQLIEFPIFAQHRHTRHAAQLFFHCIEQRDLHTWSFGELPKVYQQKRGGFEVRAYPALVDKKDSVEI
ncbi:DUF3418 domain-containing protein, partial [Vibrio cholerae]|uniref:DUF3418 domain-containing protein n=1 Tax=Vibrio cholerae TaxID=666 RepID=UPI0030809BCC